MYFVFWKNTFPFPILVLPTVLVPSCHNIPIWHEKMFQFAFGMWFNLAGRDSFERSLTHSQDALSLPGASNKEDEISQRENSGDFVSVIPLRGCPHTSAKTQQGAFMRAPSLLFQRYSITQAPSYEVGL